MLICREALDDPIYYRGVRIKSVPHLHEQIVELLPPPPATVLDVGAGAGALSLRLRDLGYEVDALDKVLPDHFDKSVATHFFKIKLDNPHWHLLLSKHYDIVICSEVIEHLDNPRQLVRCLGKVVKPGGIILISTPNLEQPISKLHFLLSGRFAMFFDSDEKASGHISPISEWQMKSAIRGAGLSMVSIHPGGVFPILYLNPAHKSDSILWSILSLATVWSRERSQCKIYKLTRTKEVVCNGRL